MKAMICEMCGSNKLVKQDGLYICQYCGTGYSVEEAKKLLINGTVKIDHSEELANLYVVARRARDTDNTENAQKFYEQILVKDPSSWEANFYSVYYQSMNCVVADIYRSAMRIVQSEKTILTLVKNSTVDKSELSTILNEMTTRLVLLSNMLIQASEQHHFRDAPIDIVSQYANEHAVNGLSAIEMLYSFGDYVIELFGDNYGKEISLSCWQSAVPQHKKLLKWISLANMQNETKKLKSYKKKIKEYSNYDVSLPSVPQSDFTISNDKTEIDKKYNHPAQTPKASDIFSSAKESFASSALFKTIGKMRKGMKIAMIVCLVLAIIYLLMATSTPSLIAMFPFCIIFCLMFLVLGITPKEHSMVTLFKKQISKKVFVCICILLAFILFGITSSSIS